MSDALVRAMRDPVVVERGGMLLLRTAPGWRGQQEFTLGIRAADGEVPRFLADGPSFPVVDGVAVLTGVGGTDGWSLETWARVWHRDARWGHTYAMGEALLMESPGVLQRVDARSGMTRWTLSGAGIFTRVTQFEGRLIIYDGAQTLFPDRGIVRAVASGAWVQAYDLQTGGRLWRVVTPAPVLDVLRGTRTLIVRMCEAGPAGPRFSVASVTADGRIAWVHRDEGGAWSMPRLGPHLATLSRDGTLSVWG